MLRFEEEIVDEILEFVGRYGVGRYGRVSTSWSTCFGERGAVGFPVDRHSTLWEVGIEDGSVAGDELHERIENNYNN
jgi:hypothetical protein